MSVEADFPQLPWPRPGDQLFAEADDWWMNACVNWGGGNATYEVGYRRAGDALVEEVARNRVDAASLVYPIVCCYRQYLELLLKDVLAEARRYYDIDEPVPTKHSLLLFWQPLRKLLAQRWPEEQSELEAVGDAVRQFDAVDQLSYAFRYATTPKGKQSLPTDMLRINLRNFAEVVARVGTFLETSATVLNEEYNAADFDTDYGY
jgi:hypothetical protein